MHALDASPDTQRATLPAFGSIRDHHQRRSQRLWQGDVPIATDRPIAHEAEQNAVAQAPSDVDLMRRLRMEDGNALAMLYDRHAANVFGLARSILRDDGLAEEVTHDVFLGLWQQPHAYEPSRGAFVGWFLRVTRNRAIDTLRRRRERPFPVSGADGPVADDLANRLVDPDPDPADQATTNLLRQDVRAALPHLAPDHHRLLELAYFDGLTQREIAARLDRPLGTVKTQIRTAMRRLAGILADADPGATDPPPSHAGPTTPASPHAQRDQAAASDEP